MCIQFNAYADVDIDSREQSNVTPILPHNEMDKKINKENAFTPYSFEDAWLNGDFLKPYSIRGQYMLIPTKKTALSLQIQTSMTCPIKSQSLMRFMKKMILRQPTRQAHLLM